MHRSALILMLACERAAAHPGADMIHFMSEPDHLAALLAPLVIGVIWFLRRKKRKSGSDPDSS